MANIRAIVKREIDYDCIFKWTARLITKLTRMGCQECKICISVTRFSRFDQSAATAAFTDSYSEIDLEKLHSLADLFANMSQYFSFYCVTNNFFVKVRNF